MTLFPYTTLFRSLGTLPEALKDAINNGSFESDQSWVDAVSKNGNVEDVNNPNDNEIIDLNNLTNDQKIEINKYAVQLINSYLQQMGKQPAKTNQNMIDLTNAVVQIYNENNWNPFADHTGDSRGTGENNAHFATALDDKALMQKYGLNTAWSGMAENVGMTNLNKHCTMNDLKSALATTIVGMVSHDANSG